MSLVDDLIVKPQYSLDQPTKDTLLQKALTELEDHHLSHCQEYRKIRETLKIHNLEDNKSFLPVSLFKTHTMKSIPDEKVHKTLTSSGTTGQAVSKIYLDAETATLQVKALAAIMAHELGPNRLPMLIIDSAATLKNRQEFSARSAGILGMMTFGRNHCFALNDDLSVNEESVLQFLAKHKGQPKLIFGFTFLVWQSLMALGDQNRADFKDSILIHSGGWKKLAEKSVSNEVFKATLKDRFHINKIFNFYGMVEQVGSVFLEGEDGLLYPPNFADVFIRHPHTLKLLPPGEEGVVQVVSLLPKSYPGHSLLTEDLGVVHYVDKKIGGRMGKAFSISGRIPQAELRGCSDVIAQTVGRS